MSVTSAFLAAADGGGVIAGFFALAVIALVVYGIGKSIFEALTKSPPSYDVNINGKITPRK